MEVMFRLLITWIRMLLMPMEELLDAVGSFFAGFLVGFFD